MRSQNPEVMGRDPAGQFQFLPQEAQPHPRVVLQVVVDEASPRMVQRLAAGDARKEGKPWQSGQEVEDPFPTESAPHQATGAAGRQ